MYAKVCQGPGYGASPLSTRIGKGDRLFWPENTDFGTQREFLAQIHSILKENGEITKEEARKGARVQNLNITLPNERKIQATLGRKNPWRAQGSSRNGPGASDGASV